MLQPLIPRRYFDGETGKHYNYFRDYDPGTGRYTESDPVGLDGGLNTYVYVDGAPIASLDRLGLFKYNKPSPDTVPLPPGMEQKVDCIEKCIGISLVVTGGAEKKGHTPKSLHYQGRAADFGFNSNPGLRGRASEFMCCALSCGFGYGQVEGPPKFPPQIHLQDGPGNGISSPISWDNCSCKTP